MEIDSLALCSAPPQSSFVGVTLAVGQKEPNSIFATFQNIGVHQYDVRAFFWTALHGLFVQLQEQRCLQSWLVPSGTELTFPATQHPIAGIYSVLDITDLLLSVSSVCSKFLKISPAYLARRSVLCSKRSHCPWLEQVQQQRGPMEETKGALLPPNRQLTSRSLMRL